jgi:hypothetical protein
MIQKFYEYKLSTENYSKYFYLVLNLTEKTLKSLYKGKIDKLVGISDSEQIINAFFDIRDVLLVMDKDKVINLNEVENVDYDDVEYLVKDNFKKLSRITGHYKYDDEIKIKTIIYQAFRKHTYNSKSKGIINELYKLKKLIKSSDYSKLFDYIDSNTHKIFNFKVSGFNDLVNKTLENLKNEIHKTRNFGSYEKLPTPIDENKVSNILKYLILSYASLFKDEGEWLIKNDSFIIPENSTILIKENSPNSYTNKENMRMINEWLDELKTKYKIKFLPYVKGGYVANTYKKAFPIIRYLDKIKTFEFYNKHIQ